MRGQIIGDERVALQLITTLPTTDGLLRLPVCMYVICEHQHGYKYYK